MNSIEKFGIAKKLAVIAKNPPNDDCAVYVGKGWEFHVYDTKGAKSYWIVESDWIKCTIYDGKTMTELVDSLDEDKNKSPLKARILKEIKTFEIKGA